MNWPNTTTVKSQANDFTRHERLDHSCMWTSQEQARAETLKRQAEELTAAERAKETTAYTPLSLIGHSKPRRSRK